MHTTDKKPANKEEKSGTLSTLNQERATKSNAIEIPQISLPKGGGTLKGIDEKFDVLSRKSVVLSSKTRTTILS